jgi:hypothetical protein
MIPRFTATFLGLVMFPLFLSADTLQTFDVLASIDVPASPSNLTALTGTATIDITTGTILNGVASVSSQDPGGLDSGPMDLFNNFADPLANEYFMDFCEPGHLGLGSVCNGFFAEVILSTDSLVAYSGGGIVRGFVSGFAQNFGQPYIFTSGQLAPVQEPSSPMLLGGVVLLFLNPIRRKLAGFLAVNRRQQPQGGL